MQKTSAYKTPFHKLASVIRKLFVSDAFRGSKQYWERRYRTGGNSGVGSYGKFADFKAEVLNDFILQNGVSSVIEFGHGDGNQLTLAKYESYMGFDVSDAAVAGCRQLFSQDPSKAFFHLRDYCGQTARLSLSLDVIFHLVEDKVFEDYMRTLFSSSTKFVIIYSSNSKHVEGSAPHVRHREFSRWVENNIQGWALTGHMPNRYPYKGNYLEESFSEFYFYTRSDVA